MAARQKMEHVFQVKFDSDMDNRMYTGTFTAKKLSILDQSRINVRKSQLSGGMYYDPTNPGIGVDDTTDHINYMLAVLEHALVDTPPWWDPEELGDVALMGVVFKEVMEFQTRFRREREAARGEGSSGSGEGDGSEETQGTHTVGNVREVVGEEVQAALEP